MTIRSIDLQLVHFFRNHSEKMSRWAICVVYVWFGILKIIGASPASGLVSELLAKTIPFMTPVTFISLLGMFEVLIGIFFLIKGMERLVIPMLILHLFTTIMPLFLLPSVSWTGFLIPTLEGQYIIKNILIIACAMGIAGHLHVIKVHHHLSKHKKVSE